TCFTIISISIIFLSCVTMLESESLKTLYSSIFSSSFSATLLIYSLYFILFLKVPSSNFTTLSSDVSFTTCSLGKISPVSSFTLFTITSLLFFVIFSFLLLFFDIVFYIFQWYFHFYKFILYF